MTIIAIANQKGGCGKTTTTINLAACLGRKGRRVLIVDMDPQGHSSLGLGVRFDDAPGLYEVFANEAALSDVVQHNIIEGVDLIPANISLAAVDHLLADVALREQQLALHLKTFEQQHDYVLIDCPPGLGLLSINALMASNKVIIPIEMSLFALDGIDRLYETIDLLRDKYDLELSVMVLPTLVDNRTLLARKFLREIWERFADEVSPVMIHHTVKLKEAVCKGLPIIDYDIESPASADYYRLAKEVIKSSVEQGIPTLNTEDVETVTDMANDLMEESTSETYLAENDLLQEVILNLPGYANRNVQIAGDFNDWIPDQDVETRKINGNLQKVVTVPPGLYHYRLVIDGKWVDDPTNPEQVPNLVGGHNSLLRVPDRRQAMEI